MNWRLLDTPKPDRLYEFSRWMFYFLSLALGIVLGLIIGFCYGSLFGFVILPALIRGFWGS